MQDLLDGGEDDEFDVDFPSTSPLTKCQLSRHVTGNLRANIGAWCDAGAPKSLLDLVQKGVHIPFIGGVWPGEYHNAHNCIEAEHVGWCRDAIAEMLHFGAVPMATSRPRVVSPLLVTLKPSSSPGKPKYRLYHSLVWLNEFISKCKFKLDKLSDFGKNLEEEDEMIGIDFESGYFHCEMEERFRKFLGFKFDGVYYEFIALPFGLRCSAYYFQLLTSWSVRLIRNRLHINTFCYLDDSGYSCSPAVMLAQWVPERVVALLEALGWCLNLEKCTLSPTKRLDALGFVTDSLRLVFELTVSRKRRWSAAVAGAISALPYPSARQVARVAGHAASSVLALGPVARLRSRYLMSSLRFMREDSCWDQTVLLDPRAIEELHCLQRLILDYVPQRIFKFCTAPDFIMSSDASDTAVAAIIHRDRSGPCAVPIWRLMTDAEKAAGSMLRELGGYRHALRTLYRHYPVRGAIVKLTGDALSALHVFRNGGSQQLDDSGTLVVLEVVLDMYQDAWAAGAELWLFWRPRRFVQDADDLSKIEERHAFCIDKSTFAREVAPFGPFDVDWFASTSSTVTPSFFSRFHCAESEGCDAFSATWTGRWGFFLPPFEASVFDRILDKFVSDNAGGVLIVPEWSRAAWFQRLFFSGWSRRVTHVSYLPGSCLVALSDECFFGHSFNVNLRVCIIQPLPPV